VGGAAAKAGHDLAGEFTRGVLATILATPCSGPLLGATLAWTLNQSITAVFVVFISVGVGMALPYVLLSASERVMRFVPKPGRWMDDLKHALGFLLLGFAVYLMMGLDGAMIVSTVATCLFIALALALYGRFAPFGAPPQRKVEVGLLACMVFAAGVYVSFGLLYRTVAPGEKEAGGDGVVWRTFSREALLDAHARGQHAMVDFTASWCMNCQYNKAAVLTSRRIGELVSRKDVEVFEADLTAENPMAESLLEHLGSRSIPFLAVFPGHDPYNVVVMRDVLSRKRLAKVLDALPEK
jgi:thiol:disulfide interchange protein DsbD